MDYHHELSVAHNLASLISALEKLMVQATAANVKINVDTAWDNKTQSWTIVLD